MKSVLKLEVVEVRLRPVEVRKVVLQPLRPVVVREVVEVRLVVPVRKREPVEVRLEVPVEVVREAVVLQPLRLVVVQHNQKKSLMPTCWRKHKGSSKMHRQRLLC